MLQTDLEKNGNRTWLSPMPDLKTKRQEPDLNRYDGEDKVISSVEWLAEHDQEPPYLFSLKSRIPALDNAVDGFRNGELYTISGFTKHGKTTFARTLTDAFVKQQFLPLWFSYEVPPRQFLETWKECPFFYIPRVHRGKSMVWFLDRCEESFLKHGTRVIFIDHLHYLFDMAKSRSPSIDIGQIIRTLKTMAVQNGLLVFLICHTAKTSGDSDPTYNDLRDSSFMAQESDSVIMIQRMENTKHAKAFVEFHRRTGVVREIINLQMLPSGLLGEPVEPYRQTQGWQN
jgi:replicative DNA helicase